MEFFACGVGGVFSLGFGYAAFMFMAGVSMPFSLSRYKDVPDKWVVYRRIIKRVFLLWISG